MQDRDLNRKFDDIGRRLDRVENTKPGEPVMGSELDKTLRKIDENTSGIKVDLGTIKERVDNHIKFFWGVASVFVILCATGAGYIYSQQGRLSHLEAVLPTARLANASVGALSGKKIQKIQKVIADAKQGGARIEPEALSTVSRHLVLSSTDADPKLADAAWKTVNQMVEYRSILNEAFLPVFSAPIEQPITTHYSFVSPSAPEGPKTGVVGVVPIDQSAIMEPIGAGLNKHLKMGNQYVIVAGSQVKIDGLQMKNVIFQGVKIIYEGGPLLINNVYFVNCTFEIPKERRGQDLVFALLQSPITSFSAS